MCNTCARFFMQAGPARRILRNWHVFCIFKGDDTIPVGEPRHDPVREAGGCIKGEHIMKLGDIYIMGAVRTAIGKYGGSLKNVPAHELASLVIRESLNRSGVPDSLVDEVILGEVRQTTEASNIARAALLEAGLPESVPGFTVNRLCASAMQAVYSGCQEIRCGIADVIVNSPTPGVIAIHALMDDGEIAGDDYTVSGMALGIVADI